MREQLAYCVPLGLPHSIFLGRVVEPGEPQWLPDDTDKALAFKRYERTVCPNCGTRQTDWVDDDGEPLAPPPLEPVPQRCPGCAEIDRTRDFIREHKLDEHGVFVTLMPFDPDRDVFGAGG